jgi:hypothetical protein
MESALKNAARRVHLGQKPDGYTDWVCAVALSTDNSCLLPNQGIMSIGEKGSIDVAYEVATD